MGAAMGRHDGGVVIDDINLPSLRQRCVQKTVHLFLIRKLTRHGDDLNPERSQFAGYAFGVGQCSAMQDEIGAQLCQAFADMQSNAPASARDE